MSIAIVKLEIEFLMPASYAMKINEYYNAQVYVIVLFLTNATLKVIYHPLYSMNNFVTNNSKLPQDGAQVFLYMG